MKTATFVRNMDWNGDAALYKLSEPVSFKTAYDASPQTTGWVIASSVIARDHGGQECMIFPAKENGQAWSMLDIAARRGTLCHATVLAKLGYKIKE